MAKKNTAKNAAKELAKIKNYEDTKKKKVRNRNILTVIACCIAAFAIVFTVAIVQTNVATVDEATDTSDTSTTDDSANDPSLPQQPLTTPPEEVVPSAPEGAGDVTFDGTEPIYTPGSTDWNKTNDVYVQTIEEGTGEVLAATDTISAKYQGWNAGSGDVFDGTFKNGTDAISFPLSGVIGGWTYGISGHKVGSKLAIYIPGAYGYGNAPSESKPSGPLVFYVDVVSKDAA